jgi:CRP-like cAMP-binding protein
MTHEEIAKNIGASRESVSRILKDLRNRGVISVNRGMITILHAIELSSLRTPS